MFRESFICLFLIFLCLPCPPWLCLHWMQIVISLIKAVFIYYTNRIVARQIPLTLTYKYFTMPYKDLGLSSNKESLHLSLHFH